MIRRRLGQISLSPLVREGAPALGLYWLYASIRWFVAREGPYEAFHNAFKIIQFEVSLGIFHEQAIQSWLIDHALPFVHLANAFYTVGYFPIIILCGALLYRFDPARYVVFKLTFILGLGFALLCFSLFPLAPPRMLPEIGFVDTQQVFGSGLFHQQSVLSLYNPFAAMPSLHFGWALLVGIMAYSIGRQVLKVLGVLYPASMAGVIVITGHHFFLDIAGGAVVIGLAYRLVRMLPLAERLPTPVQSGFRKSSAGAGPGAADFYSRFHHTRRLSQYRDQIAQAMISINRRHLL